MRIVAVKMCFLVLITTYISGCSATGVYFTQCKTPDIKYPEIDNNRSISFEGVHDKVLINYEKMKKYATDLYDANQVCK